jgi:hypothetical protein
MEMVIASRRVLPDAWGVRRSERYMKELSHV